MADYCQILQSPGRRRVRAGCMPGVSIQTTRVPCLYIARGVHVVLTYYLTCTNLLLKTIIRAGGWWG
jgi:hypothetical protein